MSKINYNAQYIPKQGAKIREKKERIISHRHKKTPHWYYDLYIICSWCKRQKIGNQWMYTPVPYNKKISHGICNNCLEKELKNYGR